MNYLHPQDVAEIAAPCTEKWADADCTDWKTDFSINSARDENWRLAILEAGGVIKQLQEAFGADNKLNF